MKKLLKKKSIKAMLGTLIFLIAGIIAFIVGAYLSNWDIWSWFSSNQAIFFYLLGAVILVLVISLILKARFLK